MYACYCRTQPLKVGPPKHMTMMSAWNLGSPFCSPPLGSYAPTWTSPQPLLGLFFLGRLFSWKKGLQEANDMIQQKKSRDKRFTLQGCLHQLWNAKLFCNFGKTVFKLTICCPPFPNVPLLLQHYQVDPQNLIAWWHRPLKWHRPLRKRLK